jgi:hypothetical protein
VRMLTLRRNQIEVDQVCQLEKDQLDKLIIELESVENVAKSVHQSVKNLTKQMLCTGKVECTLTSDLLNQAKIFGDDDAMNNLLEECNSFAQTNNASGKEFITSLKKAVLVPLELLRRAMNEVRAELRIYNSLEMQVTKLQRKVTAHSDKERTGPNLVKLQEMKLALAVRRNEFTKLTQQMLVKLSKLLSASVELLNSCIKGFIAAELSWKCLCKQAMCRAFSKLPTDLESNRVKSMGESMKALNALSICLDLR